jgi:phosphoesterase RecJ-like protein
MKLAATALLRARVVPQKRFAYTWVREEEWKRRGVEPDALSFLANDLRMIRGIAVSLFLVEKEGKWEGHLRSRGEYKKNLGAIAARFGGGGHVHAAGFSTTLPLRTILTRILSLL